MSDVTTEAIPAVVVPGKCLGKTAPKFDPRTLRLARYIEKRKLPRVPKSHNLSKKTLAAFHGKLGMMRNDTLGLCTCAALAHAEQTWSTYGGKPRRPSDEEIVAAYNLVNNGVDEGAAMLDVLKMARNVGIGGNKIHGFVAIDSQNHDQLRTAHYLFGTIYLGLSLPVSAQTEKVWSKTEGHGTELGGWGGHAVNVVDYDETGLTVVTWGALQKMTWAWADRFADEAYTIVEEDWVGSDGRSPQGFSLSRLEKDLEGLS